MAMPDFKNQTAHHRLSPPTGAEAWTGETWVPGRVMAWVKDPTGWWGFFWPADGYWHLNHPAAGWLTNDRLRASGEASGGTGVAASSSP
jgi:hypothetical protein